jgi:hypothetical protein
VTRPTLAPLVAFAALAATCALAPEARAGGNDDLGDYRDVDRSSRYDSPQHFAFELRFGPYVPDIDDDFGGLPPEQRPFRRTFGKGKGFHFGAEFDWQAVRIPYVGTFGPGVGLSRVNRSAKAFVLNSDERSSEKTTLSITPAYLVGVLRLDYLMRRYGVPLVPYGKAGLGAALWSSSIASGVVTRDEVEGRGRSFGTHFAAGAAFLLDVIDRQTAQVADRSIGLNNSYAYIEYMRNDLGDLFDSKQQLRVGTSTWVAGLALEF